MKPLAFIGIEFILEESYEVLFEDDYITGYPQFRYPKGLPRQYPSCSVWTHHNLRTNEKEAWVNCPMFGHEHKVKKYKKEAKKLDEPC